MGEMPDVIRRAIEAQARRTGGRVSVAAVEEALAAGDPIPTDEDEWERRYGRVPEVADPEPPEAPAVEPVEQLALDPDAVRPYRANDDVPAAHDAAARTVAREGAKRTVTPGSHRHVMLGCYRDNFPMTLIEAGQYAHDRHGVGRGTRVGWDEGRRRASELAEFGLLTRTVGPDGEAFYALNDAGREALRQLDAGKRWADEDGAA